MYAVEFETDIEDGIVHIPDDFVQGDKVHARVIILVNEEAVDPEIQALSDHSASIMDGWDDPKEDLVWT